MKRGKGDTTPAKETSGRVRSGVKERKDVKGKICTDRNWHNGFLQLTHERLRGDEERWKEKRGWVREKEETGAQEVGRGVAVKANATGGPAGDPIRWGNTVRGKGRTLTDHSLEERSQNGGNC